MSNIIKALRMAFRAAIDQYKFARHMQRGGNPDVLPF